MRNLRKKISVIICGILFSLIILELAVRAGGFIFSFLQEYKNMASIRKNGTYKIMCLGESTTAGQYPQHLEEILNKRNIGIRFSVIDKGISGSNTAALLTVLEENLNKYNPDMVVTMMGYNDKYILYYKDIPEVSTGLFQHSGLYRFLRLIYMHISNRLRKEDIYRPGGGNPDPKAAKDTNIIRSVRNKKWVLRKALELNPKNDWAYFGLGWFFQKEGSSSEAEALYGRAITLNPKNKMIYDIIFPEADKIIDIEGLFARIIELCPEESGTYAGLGFIYQAEGRFFESNELYEKAIELNPQNDFAYFGLGWNYARLGKLIEGEELVAKSIELNPENDWAYLMLGEIKFSLNRPQDIVEGLFLKAVELNPKLDSRAYNRLGNFLAHSQRRFSEAEEIYKRSIKARPKSEEGYIALGINYQKQGRFSEAEKLYQKALELNPSNDIVYRVLDTLYREIDESELAEEYRKKVSGLGSSEYSPAAVVNYRKLKKILDKRGIRLICAQYPMRGIESLKKVFIEKDNIIFVDNEKIFKTAIGKKGYWGYFIDMFGGDFGHCNIEGNRLLAENIANTILKEYFKK